jgi:hypothetical protein
MRELVEASSTVTDRYLGASEACVQARVRMEASERGWRLWRNNVGVTADHVRYGLCNESARMNKMLKSSDLIGIRPVLITADHVGTTIGQFAAVECKAGNWKPGKSKRERAQAAFLAVVEQLGGWGCVTNGELPE